MIVGNVLCDVLVSSTDAPPRAAFFLTSLICDAYQLYHILMFADDSAIMSLLSNSDAQHDPEGGNHRLTADMLAAERVPRFKNWWWMIGWSLNLVWTLQRVHFYRKLLVFNVDGALIQMFYSCFIEWGFFLAHMDRSEEQRWVCRVWLRGAAKVAGL